MANELILNLNANKINMKKMAQKGYTTATDFADYLVKKKIFLLEKLMSLHLNL